MKAAAVVVNYNGGDDLPRCLAALAAQTLRPEVVLVDCASTDGTRALAAEPPPGVVGVPLAANAGFAGGCAAGLRAVSGDVDVVGFFNPDCFPDPGFFTACRDAFAGNPALGGLAPRLVRPDRVTLDSCGQVLTPWLLRVRDRGYGTPGTDRYARPEPVLAACGAGMVYRRAALEAVAVDGAVFPVEYFAFWEDCDLGWRVANAGWAVAYEPSAVAVHRRGATAGAGEGRLIFRRPPALAACILVNRWATLARNVHLLDFLPRLPLLLLGDAFMVTLVVLRRPAVLPHLGSAPGRVRLALRQRRALRRRRLAELV